MALALSAGYRVTVAALAEDHEKLPGAHRYIDGFELSLAEVRPADAVVVATQGKRDREALAAALATPAFYLGMVGSRRKIAKLKEQLAEHGLDRQRIDALHGPAGLDIKGIEPEEIAISILGEIVRERRAGVLHAQPLSETQEAGKPPARKRA
jgi:xanthine dehydrogenase accessory factor